MTCRAVLIALAVASGSLVAQPRPMLGSAPKHARLSIQPVSVRATSATLLVTLATDAGWHVSWRNPGETGLPTRFAWNLPAGVRVRRETWPVPVVVRSDVGVAHTLEGEVPWLVEFALDTPVAADQLVSLTLRYGICRDVCIPEQQTVQGVLPGVGTAAAALTPVSEALRARLAVDVAPIPARITAAAGLCFERLPTGFGAVPLDLIAGPDRELDAALPVRLRAGTARGAAVVRLPASARLRQPSDTVWLVSGTRGAAVPLDFQAPVIRCRSR